MMIKTLKEASKVSLAVHESKEYEANFTIEVENETWNCYAVSISYRDILCYCNEGSATFLVDTWGNRDFIELFDWDYKGFSNDAI